MYKLPEHVVRDGRIHEAKNGKPDPGLLEQIIKETGADKSEAVYVGDSLTRDIYMAHKAGIKSIQCKYPVRTQEEEYNRKLVRISSWTEELFEKEKKIKEECKIEGIEPDHIISSYAEILDIIG